MIQRMMRPAFRRQRVRLAQFACAVAAGLPSARAAEATGACPAALGEATRLVLVVTPDMQSVSATLRRFERASPAAVWTAVGKGEPAVVGKAGLGWGWTFAAYARDGEPAKREGDKRAPAGFYPLGRPFGLSPGLASRISPARARTELLRRRCPLVLLWRDRAALRSPARR